MLDQFYTGFTDIKRTALMQYCEMENVVPAVLAYTNKPKKTMKFQLETTAFHLLQRIDKRLNAMISRLISDMEHNVKVQGHLS